MPEGCMFVVRFLRGQGLETQKQLGLYRLVAESKFEA